MILRSRLALIAISAALILLLLLALLHAPPDGRERGDFSQFVGRFHPLVVHLPIALLLLVPLLECFGFVRRWSHLRESAAFVLALASISAFIAVFLGWALAGEKLGVRILAATVIIVISVILVSTPKKVTREESVSFREAELSGTAAD